MWIHLGGHRTTVEKEVPRPSWRLRLPEDQQGRREGGRRPVRAHAQGLPVWLGLPRAWQTHLLLPGAVPCGVARVCAPAPGTTSCQDPWDRAQDGFLQVGLTLLLGRGDTPQGGLAHCGLYFGSNFGSNRLAQA